MKSTPELALAAAVLSFRILLIVWLTAPTQLAAQGLILDNFESYSSGTSPERRRVAKTDARRIYKIESENGNRFLRARSEGQGVQVGLEHIFEPQQHNQLAWRWRVREFPAGADEQKGDKHDAAAQVYVIFDNQIWPRVIKYIWSASLPVGTRFTHPLYSRGRVVVMKSGAAEKEKWFDEKINFYDDYKRFFNAEPGKIQGIAILSSSDSTRTVAGADYDAFALLP